MVAILIGLILIAFTVFACLPGGAEAVNGIQGLGWGTQIIDFLKGAAPCLAAFIGLIAVFIGVADLKDRKEAKKEEAAAKKAEEAAKKDN